MRKFWTGVARFFATLFCIAYVITQVLALVLVNVDRRLLNAATYKNALSSRQVYARMPRLIAEQLTMPMDFNPCADNPLQCENVTPEFKNCALQVLGQERLDLLAAGLDQPTEAELQLLQPCVDQFGTASQPDEPGQSGPPAFMQTLTVANWESIIATILPADELQGMAESIIDQIFAYLNGQQEVVSVPMEALKRRIAGQAGVDAILELIRAQSACTDEQLSQMAATLNGEDVETVLCRPPEDQLTLMVPQIRAQLEQIAAGIPGEIEILNPETGENSGQLGPFGTGPVGSLRGVRLILSLSPILPLFFLLLISLFAVRSAKGWLRWWGIPFFFAGLSAAAWAIGSSASFEQAWLALLAGRIPPYITLGMAGLLHDLLQAISVSFMDGLRNGGLLLCLLGLVMSIGSFFIRRPAKLVLSEPGS